MSVTQVAPLHVGLPLAVLHDHLDGGVRPDTLVDLARECGYTGLPTNDASELARWFTAAADSGSLERFLETFAHTVAVLQTPDALQRVAAEAVLDLATDGAHWVEIRMAPELCENPRLSMDAAVTAMLQGLREGERLAGSRGLRVDAGLIVCAMRQSDRADEVAQLVRARLDDGVVGFDIAGPERGFEPLRLREAFDVVRSTPARITVHAGEADGVESIRQAIAVGAERLGHGVRIVEDIDFSGDDARLGAVARYVRDRGIALEICPRSNVQTGAVLSADTHPIALLDELGFVVTVSADNRLMCGTTPAAELASSCERVPDAASAQARWVRNAIDASFAPHDVKLRLRTELNQALATSRGDQAIVSARAGSGSGVDTGKEQM